ncbi:MAG: MATE family efflux transporter [Erysipelotrichaceae bacterium]
MKKDITSKFNFISLIQYTLPTMMMMLFFSAYQMVDGAFVSTFVSTDALSAINILYPLINLIIAIAIMFATGGSAFIAKRLGEKQDQDAKEKFSLFIACGFSIGLLLIIILYPHLESLMILLGATHRMLDYAVDYMHVILLFAPFMIIQMIYQYFFVTAGKPRLGLYLTLLGGVINIALDYHFVVNLDLGMFGAALASGLGYLIPSCIGTMYFMVNRSNLLYFTRFHFDFKAIMQACSNGSSEMVSNLSIALITLLYNLTMLRLLQDDGVAVITVILYVQFFLNALFVGFSMGVAPIISYNFGAENYKDLHRYFKYSLMFVLLISTLACFVCIFFKEGLIQIFATKGSHVFEIAASGFDIFSISFLFSGVNIFTCALFTAYSNGKVSALLSFMRTFLFIGLGLVIFPLFWHVNGAWFSIVFAEAASLIMSIIFLCLYKTSYHL